ncbi:hypothetical protein Pelo_9136 [Pelomyxa schiedti]|nr:hypothetical protein Pelo_9136 [Pelomyxa schiedti]
MPATSSTTAATETPSSGETASSLWRIRAEENVCVNPSNAKRRRVVHSENVGSLSISISLPPGSGTLKTTATSVADLGPGTTSSSEHSLPPPVQLGLPASSATQNVFSWQQQESGTAINVELNGPLSLQIPPLLHRPPLSWKATGHIQHHPQHMLLLMPLTLLVPIQQRGLTVEAAPGLLQPQNENTELNETAEEDINHQCTCIKRGQGHSDS